MNDINRNTRTLIVSFVVAIMVMIPLRFVEVGQMVGEAQVLGEMDTQVVLPNAEVKVVKKAPLLEAPYDEIENSKVLGEKTVVEKTCIDKVESAELTEDLKGQINGSLTRVQLEELVNQLIAVEKNTCK